MSAEAIRIINAAISRTNGNLIESVDQGSPEAVFADLNYEQIVETALTDNRWNFARKTGACSLLPGTPTDKRYTKSWQLPDDLLELRAVLVCGYPCMDYLRLDVTTILVNASADVQVVFTYRVPESLWPPDFKEAITQTLEAGFLRLDERAGEAAARDQSAERRMSKTRLNRSQEEDPKDPRTAPLVNARRIGHAPIRS